MKLYKKLIISLVGVLLIATMLLGCGAPETKRPSPVAGIAEQNVTGKLEYTLEGKKLKLHADTDIMDGALVALSIENVLGENLARQVYTKEGDNLYAEFDLSAFEDNVVYGFATCAPTLYGEQQKNVYEKYGKAFENVFSPQEGSIIWNNNGVIIIFSTGDIKIK